MPTVPTPCSGCKYFSEIDSPMPGESWNRCSHKARRLETRYPCKANSYGYADKKCALWKKSYRKVLYIALIVGAAYAYIHHSNTIMQYIFN